MQYECDDCGMTIDGLICSKCNQELVDDEIEHDGEIIKISRCPQCDGKVKSPLCCGQDMQVI